MSPPQSNSAKPGECSFVPVINLVGVNLNPKEAKKLCKGWRYEQGVTSPANIYEAQLARRLRLG